MTEEATLELEETPEVGSWADGTNTPPDISIETLLQEIQNLLALTNKRDIFTSNDIQNRMLDLHNTATKIAPLIQNEPHDQN